MIDGKTAVMIGSSLAGAIAFWAAVYGWGKWLNRPRQPEQREQREQRESLAQDARLERIELAIEAVAIEVERLGESQRFTAKLLAERDRLQPGTVPPSALPPRVITPH
jgi:hypothetical protein